MDQLQAFKNEYDHLNKSEQFVLVVSLKSFLMNFANFRIAFDNPLKTLNVSVILYGAVQ